MAETNSLLNCRRGNPTGGSNPPLSAENEGPIGSFFFSLTNEREKKCSFTHSCARSNSKFAFGKFY